MEATPTKRTYQFKDDNTDVKVLIDNTEGNPTKIEFTSFQTNYHLIVDTGEFDEVYNIINKVKELL
jgi:hypothetical protein